jgi:hypothetical protein
MREVILMKRHPSYPMVAAVAAAGFIWAACTDAPTGSAAELAAPQFAKGGKKGKPPQPGDPFPTIVTFRDADGADGDNIRSDDELRSDDLYKGPAYEDGVCGTWANLGNFDDARMHPDGKYRDGKHRKTCGDSRVIIIELDDPVDGQSGLPRIEDGVFSNIDQVLLVTGPTWGVFNAPDPCGQLFFNPDNPNGAGSDLLLVSFDDNGTADDLTDDVWTVRTQDPLEGTRRDKGFCSEAGRLFHMPFEMTIRRQ